MADRPRHGLRNLRSSKVCANRRAHLAQLLAAATLLALDVRLAYSEAILMDDNTFWKLIESAKAAAGPDDDARPDALEALLLKLDMEALVAFQKRYEGYLLRANRWDLWGAAYLMNGGCSDDGFKYFRDWLISEGRSTYEGALADPDSLAAFPRREYFDLELFGYAAVKAYEMKGGGEMERSLEVELASPEGEEWEESDLPRLFPKLAVKYEAE